MTAPARLPRLDLSYPDGTEARIRAEADSRARLAAGAVTDDNLRRWHDAEHGGIPVLDDEALLLARAWYQDWLGNSIARELAAELDAAHREALRVKALDALASAYQLDPGGLDGATARRLLQDAEHHAGALRDEARTPAQKAAATRAEGQRDRLESYLTAAGLCWWDDENYELAFAGEGSTTA